MTRRNVPGARETRHQVFHRCRWPDVFAVIPEFRASEISGTHMWTAPCLQEGGGGASDRLRSYVRSVVAVAHDRCQDGFRDASPKQGSGLGGRWVTRGIPPL